MTTRMIPVTTDDLTQREAEDTQKYKITWLDEDYELDLTGASAEAITRWLIDHDVSELAFLIRSAIPQSVSDADRVRQWAKGRGLPVKDRGPIPADVQQRYDLAHQAVGDEEQVAS